MERRKSVADVGFAPAVHLLNQVGLWLGGGGWKGTTKWKRNSKLNQRPFLEKRAPSKKGLAV